MNRRNFAAQAPAALAGAALAACGGGNASEHRKPTFVFVHGGWQGGWAWTKVAQLLAERGFQSVLLDLPGHGISAQMPAAYTAKPQNLAGLSMEVSAHAGLTLNDYRDSVLKVIRGLVAAGSGPVILVGQSSGGGTLSAVAEADPSLIRRLVYQSAFVQVRFPTIIQYLQEPNFAVSEVPPLFVADPTVVGAARINHESADPAYVARLKSCFYHDLSDEAFLAVSNMLTPDNPIGTLTTPVQLTVGAWGRVSRTFVRCTADRALPIAVQDQMIADADAFTPGNRFEQITLNTSHSPFVSAPADLVEVLVSLAV
ncbi:alpha/beta fold hydrolase [Hydrogenophaga sp. OTU3427]|uniref:alpha/beta fold hydrolase n=1 Tax=Hydrogenophaga sp. OTU3427 TaxID=3043856 RepID=UPI00313F0AE5